MEFPDFFNYIFFLIKIYFCSSFGSVSLSANRRVNGTVREWERLRGRGLSSNFLVSDGSTILNLGFWN